MDSAARYELRALLRNLHRKGQTIIHVTHDYEEAVSLATRIGVMDMGKITQIDTPEKIFRHPKSQFVARFVGIRNFIKGDLSHPLGANGETAEFRSSGGILFSVLTEEPGGTGFLMIRSEDITLSVSPFHTSARNSFEGLIMDIVPARMGIEVLVDMGEEIAALITRPSMERLNLKSGMKVCLQIKASAARFFRE